MANYDVAALSTGAFENSDGFSAVETGTGYGLSGSAAGGISSGSYESSSYSSSDMTGGYTGGLESSFGSLGLSDAANGAGGVSSSYQSYSAEQAFSQ